VLWEILKRLGADRAAIDAARVLRVVGTFHSETGVVVETLVPVGEVREFEELAMEILPLDRAESSGPVGTRCPERRQEAV
jgi:hypothetical protein